MSPKEIKEGLLKFCEQSIQQRHEKIKKAIALVEEGLYEESKSTSGDKHHTGRAMLQIEREKLGRQLLEVEQLQSILTRIDISTSLMVKLGSLVSTSSGNYFISLSTGRKTLEGIVYYCIAIDAPIAILLKGKQKGDKFQFQNQSQNIISVH